MTQHKAGLAKIASMPLGDTVSVESDPKRCPEYFTNTKARRNESAL